jgi:dihydrofolate reductase
LIISTATTIVCVDRNWAIGRQGRLLFCIPADLRRFRQLTMGGTLVMGRRTWESLPGVLPGREHVVLTRNAAFAPKGATVVRSLEQAAAAFAARPAWLIGGAETFAALLPLCRAAYVTQVDAAAPDADAFFPNLETLPGWQRTALGPWQVWNGLSFRYGIFLNKNTPELGEVLAGAPIA